MRRVQSIRARLSFVFLFLFLTVNILGFESLRSLRHVNEASAQIRVRWLPSTRALGDLNNFTTDFPAAEDAMLRAEGAGQTAAIKQQMTNLDRGIAAAQREYGQLRHDADEEDLYRRFEAKWTAYRSIVADAPSSSSASMDPASGHLRAMRSKSAYDAASEMLGLLTDRNVASAREASERSDLAYTRARGSIVITIVLAGLLVVGATVHVTRSISAPLVDLAGLMHRLAASQTIIEIQGTQRHDEIGEMARAVVVFRNNAIALAQNRQTLSLQAAVLQDKLAEEQRLTQLQRNFVSMASHEFRTPLAIIDGHTQRLISMRNRLTAAELESRAHKIRSTVRRMTQLIDNLIGSARLIDARMEIYYHPMRVDLPGLVSDICHLQRELTPDVQIVGPLGEQRLPVYGDASLLSQLFGNLLSNAVKYSPDGGRIMVTVAREQAQTAVVIEDHGIGIPEADRERVFERYYRGSNTSGIVGSGVGLHLVKTIVDLHKGTIALDSREGQGSRFTIRLPAGPAGAWSPRAGADGVSSTRGPHEHDLVS